MWKANEVIIMVTGPELADKLITQLSGTAGIVFIRIKFT